jgi:nucleoside-diphosphate-sugar epimerase
LHYESIKTNCFSKKKIVIIGADGFIGSALLRFIDPQQFKIITTSRKTTVPSKGNIKFDLLDKSSWNTLLNDVNPDIVICTAWETEHQHYWLKDSNFQYMYATLDLVSECFKNNIDHFVGFGSCSEYGLSPGKCDSESTPLNPQDVYSESKVLTGIRVKEIANKFGKKANWLRLFQPYGPNENPLRLIPSLINASRTNNPFKIHNPEDQLDFIHTQDVASAVQEVLLKNYPYSVNIGTGIPKTIKEVATTVYSLRGFILNNYDAFKQENKNLRNVYVDADKEYLLKNWKAKMGLTTGLKNLITTLEFS